MKKIFLVLAAGATALVVAVSSRGFVPPPGTNPPPMTTSPCEGDCVPRSDLVDAEKRSAKRLRGWRRANRRIVRLNRTWRPTFEYGVRLASAVYGVPAWQLRNVAGCESTLNPFARNGVHKGYWQLSWSPFGFSPYDPVASALSTAQTVKHDGSWRQWDCKP